MTDRGYVVILFGNAAEGYCNLARCPLGTAEWFPTHDAAQCYASTVPPAFDPHVLMVQDGSTGDPPSVVNHLGVIA